MAAIAGCGMGVIGGFGGVGGSAFTVAIHFGEPLVNKSEHVLAKLAVLCDGFIIVKNLLVVLIQKIAVVVHAASQSALRPRDYFNMSKLSKALRRISKKFFNF